MGDMVERVVEALNRNPFIDHNRVLRSSIRKRNLEKVKSPFRRRHLDPFVGERGGDGVLRAERVAAGETRQNLWDISFSSPTEGWMVGSYGSIQHTTDGGQNWEDQNSGIDNNLKAIVFVNQTTGWIAGQEGVILHTNDGGGTWTKQKTNSYNNLNDIIFVNKDIGWVAGDFGTILHTTNGGQTWDLQNAGTSTTLLAIGAVGEDHCLAIGEWGLVLGRTK